MTWELFGVRTWSVPVSGTHLGRVGICQWLYSVYSACTVAVLHSTVRDIRRGQCPLLTVHCPGPGVTREKSLQRELMSIKTHKLLTAGSLVMADTF